MRTVRPSSGAPFSRVRQKPSLTITARAPPTVCSSATKPRPTAGWTPITSKNSRDTMAPGVIVVSPVPTTTGDGPDGHLGHRAKLRVPFFQSSKFGSDTLPLRAPLLSIWNSRTMPSGSRIRQRPQQHAVDDAEDGGGGADAERRASRSTTIANAGARRSTRAP